MCQTIRDKIYTFETIFTEGVTHARHKDKCRNFCDYLIQNCIIKYCQYFNTFESIFNIIYKISEQFPQCGQLISYDITAGICRHYGIPIKYVYLAGKGPKEAVEKLGIHKKKCKKTGLSYVEVHDVLDTITPNIQLSKLIGDDLESWLCINRKDF